MNFAEFHTPEAVAWWMILASPFIGSFVAASVERYARGENFITGRSKCDHCGITLRAFDLIPILSSLALSSTCRYCRNPFGKLPIMIEAGYLLVTASTACLCEGPAAWLGCLLAWLLLALALIDFKTFSLPDALTLPMIATGLAFSSTLDWQFLVDHLAGSGIGFASLFTVARIYRALTGREGLGMGDAKLFAVAGAWLGTLPLPGVLLVAASSALFITLVFRIANKNVDRLKPLPFGPYLSFSIWLAWILGPLAPVSL